MTISNPTNSASIDLARIERESFVDRVEHFAEIASTNDYALEVAERADQAGSLLVLADRQTAGRGRGSNRWWSASGSLTFSLLVDCRLSDERRPQVSLATGLAVCEALGQFVPASRLGLKWPNDVFLDGKKTCGILVEVSPRRPGRLVIGIGINVNNSFATRLTIYAASPIQ